MNSWKAALIKFGEIGSIARSPIGSLDKYVSPQDFKAAGGESMDAYWKHLLSSHLIKGKFIPEIAADTQLNEWQVRTLLHRYWGGEETFTRVDGVELDRAFSYARKALMAPRLAYCYSKNMGPMEIALKRNDDGTLWFPFLKGEPMMVRYWTREWFRGITPTQARTAFSIGLVTSIEEFFNRFLS